MAGTLPGGEYIRSDLQEHAGLVLEVYDWLVKAQSGRGQEARGMWEYPGMGFIYQ